MALSRAALALALGLGACAPAPQPSPAAAAVYVLSDQQGVFTLDAALGNRRDLVADGVAPSWTPDGRIVYSTKATALRLMAADGSGDKAVPIGSLGAWMPQMARDGTIMFMCRSPGSGPPLDVCTVREDGSAPRIVVHGSGGPAIPSLARSGRWFTYTVQTPHIGGTPPYHRQIWRVDLSARNAKALTFAGDPNYPDANASSISPDESMVAFFSGTESDDTDPNGGDPATWGWRNVAVVPAAGGPRRTITDCKPLSVDSHAPCVAADNPTWTPDGRSLIFDQGGPAPEVSGTFVIGIDGTSKARRLWPQTSGGRVPMR